MISNFPPQTEMALLRPCGILIPIRPTHRQGSDPTERQGPKGRQGTLKVEHPQESSVNDSSNPPWRGAMLRTTTCLTPPPSSETFERRPWETPFSSFGIPPGNATQAGTRRISLGKRWAQTLHPFDWTHHVGKHQCNLANNASRC